jgi:hypothetical protein
MGMDAGACGAFGLYLPQFEQLGDLYKELQDYVEVVRDGETDEDALSDPIEFDRIPKFTDRFVAAFAEKYDQCAFGRLPDLDRE